MIRFVTERENKFYAYYVVIPKKGIGTLVKALNGQQAIAQVTFNSIVCVRRI